MDASWPASILIRRNGVSFDSIEESASSSLAKSPRVRFEWVNVTVYQRPIYILAARRGYAPLTVVRQTTVILFHQRAIFFEIPVGLAPTYYCFANSTISISGTRSYILVDRIGDAPMSQA